MAEPLVLADISAVEDASELLASFGYDAADEAAARANRSRVLGNVIHFCHWRQVERLITVLGDDQVIGTIH